MILIGITGGIGSGKSTVSDYLTEKGCTVLDADKVCREIVEPGSDTLKELRNAFGSEIINDDGSLNRKKLAGIAFSDPKKKETLDGIMHRKVIEILLKRAEALSGEKAVFIDAPLLFESNLDRHLDMVWLVDAEEEARINRVQKRDSLSKEEIQKRINLQMSRKEKLQRADYIIDNSGSKEDLYRQLNLMLKTVLGGGQYD